jgi:hypothetical protein
VHPLPPNNYYPFSTGIPEKQVATRLTKRLADSSCPAMISSVHRRADRFSWLTRKVVGKRLTYKELTSKSEERPEEIPF